MADWFLGKDETVVFDFLSQNLPLYITNKRIIFLKESWTGAKEFKEMSLKHLSQINASKSIIGFLVVLGFIILASGLFIMPMLGFWFIGIPLFIMTPLAFILILCGFFGGTKEIVFIADSGFSLKTPFKSEAQLESIIKIVRKYE